MSSAFELAVSSTESAVSASFEGASVLTTFWSTVIGAAVAKCVEMRGVVVGATKDLGEATRSHRLRVMGQLKNDTSFNESLDEKVLDFPEAENLSIAS